MYEVFQKHRGEGLGKGRLYDTGFQALSANLSIAAF